MIGGIPGNAPGINVITVTPERPRERLQDQAFSPVPGAEAAERQARRDPLTARPVLPSTASDRPRLSREDGTDLPRKNQEAIRTYQQNAAPTPQPDAAQIVGVDTFA